MSEFQWKSRSGGIHLKRPSIVGLVLIILLGIASAGVDAAPRRGNLDISGKWKCTVQRLGTSTWIFTPLGNGRYSAVEHGMGNATGLVQFNGTQITLNFTTGPTKGYYIWVFGYSTSYASGTLEFTEGPYYGRRYSSSLQR